MQQPFHAKLIETSSGRDKIFRSTWQQLTVAVEDRDHAWNRPVVGSVSEHGCELRTVILRDACPSTCRLWLYTDRRSAKFQQWLTDSTSSWLFYDHAARIQIVARGRIMLSIDGEDVDRRWHESTRTSRALYQTKLAPGTPLTTAELMVPASPPTGSQAVDPEEHLCGRENFAVACLVVESLDWLRLDRGGNRRIRFERTGAGWRNTPIAP